MEKYPRVGVGALIVNSKGEVLLTQSHKWNNLWLVPGGHVEYGEKIQKAVKREIKEEVGLDIEFKKILLVQEMIEPKNYIKGGHHIGIECLCSTKNDNVKIDNDEIQDYKWVKPEDGLKMKTIVYTHNLIKKYLEEK